MSSLRISAIFLGRLTRRYLGDISQVPHRLEAELGPGDVLFIPALWFHNVTSTGCDTCPMNPS